MLWSVTLCGRLLWSVAQGDSRFTLGGAAQFWSFVVVAGRCPGRRDLIPPAATVPPRCTTPPRSISAHHTTALDDLDAPALPAWNGDLDSVWCVCTSTAWICGSAPAFPAFPTTVASPLPFSCRPPPLAFTRLHAPPFCIATCSSPRTLLKPAKSYRLIPCANSARLAKSYRLMATRTGHLPRLLPSSGFFLLPSPCDRAINQ